MCCNKHYIRFRKYGDPTFTHYPRIEGDFTEAFWSFVEKTSFCWLWRGKRFRNGYGRVSYKGKTKDAHRIAFELTKGVIPKKLFVLHSCDNPPCVNPDHLRTGTIQDNIQDRVKRNRNAPKLIGEENHQAVLTDKLVLEIRSSGLNFTQISKRYGISRHAATCVMKRKSWKHL